MNIPFISTHPSQILGRMTFLFSAVEKELDNYLPFFDVMRKQLAGSLEETESGVMAVITRINAVHGLSCDQVDRIQQTLRHCMVIIDVFREQGEQNEKVVAIVYEEIHKHRDELRNSIERAQTLSREVQELQDIVDLIAGIANQTNLLALNGAIQAAHAGQAGAGFSVVASEMKILSLKTSEAAENIADKITDISKRMSAELAATEQSASTVRQSADTLKKIIQDISAIEVRFHSSIGEMQEIIENVQAGNSNLVTQLSEALGYIQFQDVVRQRVEQVDQALQELSEHTQSLAGNLSDAAWDGTFLRPLKVRLDHQVSRYVMASQRDTHAAVIGSELAGSENRPAIELF